MNGFGRTARGLALAVAVVIGVSGCVGMPGDGPVHKVGNTNVTGTDSSYVIDAEPPKSGASAVDIVRGYVLAGADARNGYSTARKFLTAQASAGWQPDAQVTVTSDTPAVSGQGASATLSINQVGTVNSVGEYQQGAQSGSQTIDLVKVGGQWRISRVPDGVFISKSNFDLVFGSHALAFLDSSLHGLVSDVRWFPAGSATSTRIMNALLSGPAPWLSGAAATAFPAGTHLSVDTVAVRNGAATVGLSSEALTASTTNRRLMRAQALASLGSLATSVSFQVNGSSLEVSGSAVRLSRVTPVVNRLIVRTSSGMQFGTGSSGSASSSVRTLMGQLGAAGAGPFAINGAHAALAANGTIQILPDGSVLGQASPASVGFDSHGFAWWAQDGQVHAATGVQQYSWGSNAGSVAALRLSPDSTRLVMLVEAGATTQVWVAAVTRNAAGDPTGLTTAKLVNTLAGTPIDAVWMANQLAVATSTSGASVVAVLDATGVHQSMTPVSGITMLASDGTDEGLRALDAAGEVLAVRGTGWVVQQRGVQAIGFAW